MRFLKKNSISNGSREQTLDCGCQVLHLSERTHVMGILNVTPDSFYDGGHYYDHDHAISHALQMVSDGADIVDIGGESTRPGADDVNLEEELRRVIPLIKELREKISVPISIDTRKSEVAESAIMAGANIINDISGLRFDSRMSAVAAKLNVPVIIMHIYGTPKNMQKNPVYNDLIQDIIDYLDESIGIAKSAGISDDKIVIDPGIGFGKKPGDNFQIIKNLTDFYQLGYPILIGVSRKSFIGWALDQPEGERLMGTAAAVTASVIHGAHIVRVHDVNEMIQVVRMADMLKKINP